MLISLISEVCWSRVAVKIYPVDRICVNKLRVSFLSIFVLLAVKLYPE